MNTRPLGLAVLALFVTLAPAAFADDGAELNSIIAEYTQATKHVDPYWATYFNVEEDLDKFGDYMSPEWLARGKTIVATAVKKLAKVDPSTLSAKDRRTYELFKGDVTVSL